MATVRSMSTQLKDVEEERERTENRLKALQKSLCNVEEGMATHYTLKDYK